MLWSVIILPLIPSFFPAAACKKSAIHSLAELRQCREISLQRYLSLSNCIEFISFCNLMFSLEITRDWFTWSKSFLVNSVWTLQTSFTEGYSGNVVSVRIYECLFIFLSLWHYAFRNDRSQVFFEGAEFMVGWPPILQITLIRQFWKKKKHFAMVMS